MKKEIDDFFGMDEFGDANAPGLLSDLRMIPIDWVESIITANARISEIILKPNRQWICMRTIHKSSKFSFTAKRTEFGVLYENIINWQKAKLLPWMNDWLNKYADVPMLFMVKTQNGFTYLVGAEKEPLSGSFDAITDSKSAMGFHYMGLSTQAPRTVNGVVELASYLPQNGVEMPSITTLLNDLDALLASGQAESLQWIQTYQNPMPVAISTGTIKRLLMLSYKGIVMQSTLISSQNQLTALQASWAANTEMLDAAVCSINGVCSIHYAPWIADMVQHDGINTDASVVLMFIKS